MAQKTNCPGEVHGAVKSRRVRPGRRRRGSPQSADAADRSDAMPRLLGRPFVVHDCFSPTKKDSQTSFGHRRDGSLASLSEDSAPSMRSRQTSVASLGSISEDLRGSSVRSRLGSLAPFSENEDSQISFVPSRDGSLMISGEDGQGDVPRSRTKTQANFNEDTQASLVRSRQGSLGSLVTFNEDGQANFVRQRPISWVKLSEDAQAREAKAALSRAGSLANLSEATVVRPRNASLVTFGEETRIYFPRS
eukprot:TRINITY_DN12071_c0_g1_i1.p1 TRINITY_DN12071_c0_g1~~TRINITY_DN12071_c0_g1_i1.p1  ORF type:complete len:270 (-),score=27.31 TRINITY_DN12071_c0_g1_i1:72-818(-)